jgi:hypothetical protein
MNQKGNPDKPPCFLAKLYKAGNGQQVPVVVKFVYNYSGTYGTVVHQYLHGLGLAPRLYSAEDLHSGLVMVVMEHLTSEEWVELETLKGKLGVKADAIRRKLEMIVKLLQKQNMVHGDLRPKNMMIKVDETGEIVMIDNEPVLFIVDFDWSGRAGEVCYPPFLNQGIPWPAGAEAYQHIGENDDRVLLDNWWGSFTQPAHPS